MKSMSLVMSE